MLLLSLCFSVPAQVNEIEWAATESRPATGEIVVIDEGGQKTTITNVGAPAEFFIEESGSPAGPFVVEQLGARVRQGTLTSSTLVWTKGMQDWQPAANVNVLAELFSVTQPPPLRTRDAAGAPPRLSANPTPAVQPDTAQFMVGTWRNRGPLPVEGFGPTEADMTVTYREDGGFSIGGQYRVSAPDGRRLPVHVQGAGNWSAADAGSERIALTVSGAITITASPEFGVAPETESLSETDQVELLDRNTIRDGDGVVWIRD